MRIPEGVAHSILYLLRWMVDDCTLMVAGHVRSCPRRACATGGKKKEAAANLTTAHISFGDRGHSGISPHVVTPHGVVHSHAATRGCILCAQAQNQAPPRIAPPPILAYNHHHDSHLALVFCTVRHTIRSLLPTFPQSNLVCKRDMEGA